MYTLPAIRFSWSQFKFLSPTLVVGIGKYGEDRARAALGDSVKVARILHPSPASPAANRGWAEQVESQLESLGIELPPR